MIASNDITSCFIMLRWPGLADKLYKLFIVVLIEYLLTFFGNMFNTFSKRVRNSNLNYKAIPRF